MKYDPIMCMNVPESNKTRDAVSNQLKAELVRSGGNVIKGKYMYFLSPYDQTIYRIDKSAANTMRARELSNWEKIGKLYDKKTVDKAIRMCDYKEDWDKDGYSERLGLYKTREYAKRQARGDEVVVKVDGGYTIMSAAEYNTWKKQR